MKKKMLAFALAGAMMTSLLAGCGDTPAGTPTTDPAAAGSPPAADGQTFNIGVCQLIQHPALDAATAGFQSKLTELLGDKVEIKVDNASGDSSTCPTIVNGFVSDGVDLIVANATSPLQSAAAGTSTIPILGTSISDYGTALDMEWTGTTGRNISGTCDLAPLDQQAAMVKELFPDAKNVGLLYCSGESNSIYQVGVIKTELESLGYSTKEYSFADSNDLASIVEKACTESDLLYVPTDNTVASNTEIIKNITVPKKIPVVAGEEGIAAGCGVATLSINYTELGEVTAQMAYDVLVDGKDITTMQVQTAPTVTKKYNAEICEALGIAAPEGYEAIEA